MLTDVRGNLQICGSPAGDKICFDPKCTIRSHQRPNVEPKLEPGLYFRVAATGSKHQRVHRAPIIPLEEVKPHPSLFARIHEFNPKILKSIAKLVKEIEDPNLLVEQLERITTLEPAPIEEDSSEDEMSAPDDNGRL